MARDLITYTLRLELHERGDAISDEQAIGLLHGDFALALNASRFDALSADDIEVSVVSRSPTRDGRTRYDLELRLRERTRDLDDERALALLRRAFTDALNASYFLRVCDDDLTVDLISRTPACAVPGRAA
ncbi:MAG: hypothetical protein Q8O56_05100 [Solirubrobacteraceae bacterium]|nr:hypothetical protein [Solirubrobacteraceae bacterium]